MKDNIILNIIFSALFSFDLLVYCSTNFDFSFFKKIVVKRYVNSLYKNSSLDFEIFKTFLYSDIKLNNINFVWTSIIENTNQIRSIGVQNQIEELNNDLEKSIDQSSVLESSSALINNNFFNNRPFKFDDNGIIPRNIISLNDPLLQQVINDIGAIYLESTWHNVHKIPFPEVLSSSIGVIKGIILPDGSYSVRGLPYIEISLNDSFISHINQKLVQNGFKAIDLSMICFGLYKNIIEGLNSRLIMVVVDTHVNLPQVIVKHDDQNRLKLKVDNDLAIGIDGIEVISWFLDTKTNEKHYIRLGSIVNGDKVDDEDIILRLS